MANLINFEEHILFSIEDRDYVAFNGSHQACEPFFPQERSLVTVIPAPHHAADLIPSIEAYVADASGYDDVFCKEFLSGIIITGARGDSQVQPTLLPQAWKTSWVQTWKERVGDGENDVEPLPGPYVLDNGLLREALRLYEDPNNAFSLPFRAAKDQRLVPLRVGSKRHNMFCVAVRSRLRDPVCPAKPLRGKRITVKEIFDIEGLQTSVGSREHLKLFPPVSSTALAISTLIHGGCQVLGLTQMCSTVLKQEPTQSIEYLSPFNPRADGWQSPSGGSSGSACAVAAYEWLDMAIASDSTISGRIPAQVAGIFSLRPSHGLLSRAGMWSGVPIQMDTSCLFGRNLADFAEFVRAWYAERLPPVRNKARPSPIVYFADFLPHDNAEQMAVFRRAVRDVENSLGVAAKERSIEKFWEMLPPDEAGGATLHDFLGQEVATASYVYSFWHRLKPFYEEYRQKFDQDPYIPLPTHLDTWRSAWDVTPTQHEEAWRRINIYKQWVLDVVLSGNVNTIVLLPLGNVRPCYRDEWPGLEGGDQMLWRPLMLSPILGSPELVVPAGEIPFHSRITGRQEYLPVCISMMGWPGSDLELIDVALDVLKKSGRPTSVKTGRRMFGGC